jgi:hypothetical protein
VSSGSVSCLHDEKGPGAATCPVALNPASLQGRAPVCHVSYKFGFCLPTGEGSGASCILRLQILPPYREGSGAATACSVVSYGSWVSSIKERLAGLHVQVDTHVPNARVLVSKVPDVRAILVL